MPSITFTVTAGEAARIQAAAVAFGFPDAKTMLVTYLKGQVAAVEQAAAVAGLAPITPIAPT